MELCLATTLPRTTADVVLPSEATEAHPLTPLSNLKTLLPHVELSARREFGLSRCSGSLFAHYGPERAATDGPRGSHATANFTEKLLP